MAKIDLNVRIERLQKLEKVIQKYEQEILLALNKDFRKPAFETWLTEIFVVQSELRYTLRHIRKWNRPQRVKSTILNFPSREYIYQQPYGRVLIIAPWNYPFQLVFCPLIGAIAAGNNVVIKPSELSGSTAQITTKIIQEVFDVKEAVVVQGDANLAAQLLKERWDYIFFTGSTKVGKIVAEFAAKNLTPVTLELGGKNPVIIDTDCDLERAAQRIVWAKFLNAGQTCIAPDYILCPPHLIEKFQTLLIKNIRKQYGDDCEKSNDFARIISKDHYYRLCNLIEHQDIIFGGERNENTFYIAPTIVRVNDITTPIMQEEIFGPILPIIDYTSESDIQKIIKNFDPPLALYVFSNRKQKAESWINNFSFGGGCINDCIVQYANKKLPFGGIGTSGMGAYHGRFSFQTFSHQKSIVKRANWLEIPLRFAPYPKSFSFLKKLFSRI